MANSWMHLHSRAAAYTLPSALAEADPFGARDCGWVEQMRPYIREFTKPGDRVLDPFAGFGSTLVAAALEGRRGVGIEIEENRHRLARERLDALGMERATLLLGDSEALAATLEPVDLVLTSMPYFGCGFESECDDQLYRAGNYGAYLEKVRTTFIALKTALRPGGYLIVAVENIRLGEQFIPQVWDVAKLMMARFDFVEDRIIVYDRPDDEAASPLSNRAHEYVLIARHGPKPCDLEASLVTARELQRAFPQILVIGSFARWLAGASVEPSDVDLLLPYDPELIDSVVRWLEADKFQVTRWGAPVSAGMAAVASGGAQYFRAERLDSDGSRVSVDVGFSASPAIYSDLAASACRVNGIRCVTDSVDLG